MVKEQAILIDKTGQLKEVKINDIDNLYKVCKLKKPDNFEYRHTWKVKIKSNKYQVKLFAKDEGRANTENKYDLPPPVDNNLYFGSLLLLGFDEYDEPIDLTIDLWESIYERLFGGFENLKDTEKEDEEEEDELDNLPDSMKTKEGYSKEDGFIVDDDDEDDELDDDEDIEEDEDELEDEDDEEDEEDELIEDCGSELGYDDYIYSDED